MELEKRYQSICQFGFFSSPYLCYLPLFSRLTKLELSEPPPNPTSTLPPKRYPYGLLQMLGTTVIARKNSQIHICSLAQIYCMTDDNQ